MNTQDTELNELLQIRRDKLKALKEEGKILSKSPLVKTIFTLKLSAIISKNTKTKTSFYPVES